MRGISKAAKALNDRGLAAPLAEELKPGNTKIPSSPGCGGSTHPQNIGFGGGDTQHVGIVKVSGRAQTYTHESSGFPNPENSHIQG